MYDEFGQSIPDLDKENEKFKKMTTSSLKSLSDTQKQKFDLIIKLRISENAMEYHRKKHRVFLKSTAILESQIAEAKEKLNTAIVISICHDIR